MDMEDMVSVIVPVYNVENYLCRCLDSIISQTYHNLQIILVDDGSPDRCGQICDEYQKKDSRITVIHKQNGGLSDARNIGVVNADGEYFTFIDSDDYVSPKMIETLYKVAKREKCKLVQCEFKSGKDENYQFADHGEYVKLDARKAFETRETKVCVWGKLYHESLIRNAGFKVGKINEDEFYTYKKIYESKEIILYQEPLYYYFQRLGSIMHERTGKLNIDVIEAFDERIAYFEAKKEQRLVDISIKEKCIRETLLYYKAKGYEDSEEKKGLLLRLFKEDYAKIKQKRFHKAEKLYLGMFNVSPALSYPVAKGKLV